MSDATCKCPFCGNEVKSDLVKRLKMQGVEVTLAEMQLDQKVEELKGRVWKLEQWLSEVDSRNARIGCAD